MMTYPDQHHEGIYKVVITLNNTGVYLIEHGLYFEAIETLKDSMQFMKDSFFKTPDMDQMTLIDPVSTVSAPSNNIVNRSEYETALQAAWRRKSFVNCHRHRNEEMTEPNRIRIRIRIVVVSDQDHPSEVHDTLIQQCGSNTSFCCVTIDLVPSFDVLGSNYDQLQRESALILYNLSIAYRCVAVIHRPIVVVAIDSVTGTRIALPTSTSLYMEYFTMSFHLVELSYTITYSMLQELPFRGVGLANVSLNLLLASLFALYNLQQMSNESKYLVDKHLHYSLAHGIMVSVIEMRTSMMTGEGENQMMLRAPAA